MKVKLVKEERNNNKARYSETDKGWSPRGAQRLLQFAESRSMKRTKQGGYPIVKQVKYIEWRG